MSNLLFYQATGIGKSGWSAHQLELQRSALADTFASGVRETIDLLTRSGMAAAMGSS